MSTPSNFPVKNAKTKKTLFSFSQDVHILAKNTRKKENYKEEKNKKGKALKMGITNPFRDQSLSFTKRLLPWALMIVDD